MEKFEEVFNTLKKEGKASVDGLVEWMKKNPIVRTEPCIKVLCELNQMYMELHGKHHLSNKKESSKSVHSVESYDYEVTIDNILYTERAKLIDSTKEAEQKVRQLFADVKDKQNVELEKFKEAVTKLAEDQKKTFEEFTQMLGGHGSRLFDAFKAGASAFKSALEKK